MDVGSGSFKRYVNLFSNVTEYKTIDVNPDFKPDIIGKAEKIPVEDSTFDSIVCTQVLGDLVNPRDAVKEFYRIIRSGGIVLLTEGFMNEITDEPRNYWRFTNFILKEIFESEGFEIAALEQIGGFFTVQAQMWTRYIINTFNLYNHKYFSKLFSLCFKVMGKIAFFLDKMDTRRPNRKFALGWIIIAKKK